MKDLRKWLKDLKIKNIYERFNIKRGGDRRNEFRFQLFIDTHLQLSLYIVNTDRRYDGIHDRRREYRKYYLDQFLMDPDYYENSICESALTDLYPHPTRCFYCGELPSIVYSVDAGNALGFDIRKKKSSSTLICVLIHIVGCKVQEHKCTVRNLARILYDYFMKFPVLIDLFHLFMRISFLGNYPFCEYRVKYVKRILS